MLLQIPDNEQEPDRTGPNVLFFSVLSPLVSTFAFPLRSPSYSYSFLSTLLAHVLYSKVFLRLVASEAVGRSERDKVEIFSPSFSSSIRGKLGRVAAAAAALILVQREA